MKKGIIETLLFTLILLSSFSFIIAQENNSDSETEDEFREETKIGFFKKFKLAFTFNREKKVERSLELAEDYSAIIEEVSIENFRKAQVMQKKYDKYMGIAEGVYGKMQELNETNLSVKEKERILRVEARFQKHEKLIDSRYNRIQSKLMERNASQEQLDKFEEFRQRAHEKNANIKEQHRQKQEEIIEKKRQNTNNKSNETVDEEENETENETEKSYPPQAPNPLSVSYSAEKNYIFLEWNNVHAGEDSGEEDGYKIWKSINSQEATFLKDIDANLTTTTDTIFSEGDLLEYYVVAWNSAGETASETASLTINPSE